MTAASRATVTVGELDEVTLVRAQRGDDAACRELVELYQRRVFGLLSRLLGRRGQVEDLAQDTFLRVFRALAGFDRRGPARLSTWILTIATRLALDELRKPFGRVVPLDPGLPAEGSTSAGAERAMLGSRLARALAELAPEPRAALLLLEVHELSYEEIAAALGENLGTVKSRISRAKAALREALAEERDV